MIPPVCTCDRDKEPIEYTSWNGVISTAHAAWCALSKRIRPDPLRVPVIDPPVVDFTKGKTIPFDAELNAIAKCTDGFALIANDPDAMKRVIDYLRNRYLHE